MVSAVLLADINKAIHLGFFDGIVRSAVPVAQDNCASGNIV